MKATGQTSAPTATAAPGTAPVLSIELYGDDDIFVRIKWTAVQDPSVDGYQVQYRKHSNNNWRTLVANIGNVRDYDYRDAYLVGIDHTENIAKNRTHRYLVESLRRANRVVHSGGRCQFDHPDEREFRVRAINGAGNGPWSNTVKPSWSDNPFDAGDCTEVTGLVSPLTLEDDGSVKLSATFEDLPFYHDGINSFSFNIRFNKPVTISAEDLRDYALSISGGTISSAVKVDDSSKLWKVKVQPSSVGSVSILLRPALNCSDQGAICTASGERLSQGLGYLISALQGLTPQLSVADTSANEEIDLTIDFTVSLAPAAIGEVTVEYATSDGTATAGDDYTDTSGTLTFTAGETSKTVQVPIINDSVEDSGETLTLTLSNASGADIGDGQAIGTIHNKEPMNATGELSIAGTAYVDETLTSSVSGLTDPDGMTGATLAYQWLRTGEGYESHIQGATSTTYTLVEADLGHAIKVRIAFTDDDDNEEVLTSAATEAITVRPNNIPTGEVTISGTVQVGQTLTADASTIADEDGLEGVTFSYQWMRSDGTTDTDIQDATSETYTPVAGDIGKALRVRVSFTDERGHEESLSSALTDGPVVSNVMADLWVTTVNYRQHTDSSLTETIYRLGHDAPAGIHALDSTSFTHSGTTYTVKTLLRYTHKIVNPKSKVQELWFETSPELPSTLRQHMVLHVGNRTFNLADATIDEGVYKWSNPNLNWPEFGSLNVKLVGPESQANNAATGAPTISGTAQVGEELTADTSGINDADGLDNASYSYQWIRNDGTTDTDIQDATSSTYTLSDDEQGKTVKVKVSFEDDSGNSETLTSAATDSVAAAPSQGLTGSFLNAPASHDGQSSFTFELRFSENIKMGFQKMEGHVLTVSGGDVTSASRVEQGSNVRWQITVGPSGDGDVTVTLPKTTNCNAQGSVCTHDGEMLSAESSLTVPGPQSQEQETVQSNSSATGAPTISGTAQAGQTLTASTSGINDADGLDEVSYSYQWIRNDGTTDSNIQDATASTYTLTDDDVGKTIKVQVSFTDDRDNQESLTSAATAAVTAKPNNAATGQPTVSGTAREGETLTAGTSGIDDADGLDDVSYSYQWLANDAAIQDATASTYTLTYDEVGKTIKVRVTFTDDDSNQESLTSAATAAVTAIPLIASVQSAPASHDGSTAFTFELRFGENIRMSFQTLRNHVFDVTGGTITKARRLTQGSNVRWEITVDPSGNSDVTITLSATTDCSAQGAACTHGGKKLSEGLQLTVSGPGG